MEEGNFVPNNLAAQAEHHKKVIMAEIIAGTLVLLGVLIFVLVPDRQPSTVPQGQASQSIQPTVDVGVEISQSAAGPADAIPETNPFVDTNPLGDIYENPFQ